MACYGVRDLVDDLAGTVYGKAVPFFHGRAVDGFFIVLLVVD